MKRPQSPLPKIRCDALHVGMPKCGSTFLQQIGFAQPSEIALVWEPGIPLFFELRNELDTNEFDTADFSRRLATYVDSRTDPKNPDAKVVFSFEGFCGPQLSCDNDRRLAEKLYELVGPTKVIFIVRQQYRLLFSLWAQYVKEGGTFPIKQFFQSPDSPALSNAESNVFTRVLFDRYVNILHDVFGPENVGVFFFEDFVANYEDFMRKLYQFIEIEVDPLPQNAVVWRGPNYFNARVIRLLNLTSSTKLKKGLLPYSFYLWYRRWFARKIFPSKKWNRSSKFDTRQLVPESVQKQIQESNSNLGKLVGRDLASIGYSTSD